MLLAREAIAFLSVCAQLFTWVVMKRDTLPVIHAITIDAVTKLDLWCRLRNSALTCGDQDHVGLTVCVTGIVAAL